MKIWSIPPRFMDNQSLLCEECLIRFAYFKIADSNDIKRNYPGIEESTPLRFQEFHAYLFIRYDLIIDELTKRGYKVTAFTEEMLTCLNDKNSNFPITIRDVVRDIELLTNLWEEYQDFDETIPRLLGQIMLTPPDQILQELMFLITTKATEYQL